jgi:hypothetical protein
MTHTPGPWEIHHYGDNEGDIHGSNGTLVCMMREGDTAPDQDWSADARLIAAAPELLAALKRMREVFEQLSEGDWRRLDATYVDQLIESDGLHGCDQAIAKAEGRE